MTSTLVNRRMSLSAAGVGAATQYPALTTANGASSGASFYFHTNSAETPGQSARRLPEIPVLTRHKEIEMKTSRHKETVMRTSSPGKLALFVDWDYLAEQVIIDQIQNRGRPWRRNRDDVACVTRFLRNGDVEALGNWSHAGPSMKEKAREKSRYYNCYVNAQLRHARVRDHGLEYTAETPGQRGQASTGDTGTDEAQGD